MDGLLTGALRCLLRWSLNTFQGHAKLLSGPLPSRCPFSGTLPSGQGPSTPIFPLRFMQFPHVSGQGMSEVGGGFPLDLLILALQAQGNSWPCGLWCRPLAPALCRLGPACTPLSSPGSEPHWALQAARVCTVHAAVSDPGETRLHVVFSRSNPDSWILRIIGN